MRYAVEKFRELSPQARSLWMDDRDQFMEAVIEEVTTAERLVSKDQTA